MEHQDVRKKSKKKAVTRRQSLDENTVHASLYVPLPILNPESVMAEDEPTLETEPDYALGDGQFVRGEKNRIPKKTEERRKFKRPSRGAREVLRNAKDGFKNIFDNSDQNATLGSLATGGVGRIVNGTTDAANYDSVTGAVGGVLGGLAAGVGVLDSAHSLAGLYKDTKDGPTDRKGIAETIAGGTGNVLSLSSNVTSLASVGAGLAGGLLNVGHTMSTVKSSASTALRAVALDKLKPLNNSTIKPRLQARIAAKLGRKVGASLVGTVALTTAITGGPVGLAISGGVVALGAGVNTLSRVPSGVIKLKHGGTMFEPSEDREKLTRDLIVEMSQHPLAYLPDIIDCITSDGTVVKGLNAMYDNKDKGNRNVGEKYQSSAKLLLTYATASRDGLGTNDRGWKSESLAEVAWRNTAKKELYDLLLKKLST